MQPAYAAPPPRSARTDGIKQRGETIKRSAFKATRRDERTKRRDFEIKRRDGKTKQRDFAIKRRDESATRRDFEAKRRDETPFSAAITPVCLEKPSPPPNRK